MIFQSWLNEAESLAKGGGIDGGDGKEIHEPYDSDEENEWKKKHKENVQKLKKENNTLAQETDEYLWKRLDELEVEEELDAYLEKQNEKNPSDRADEGDISDAGSQDWSESPGLTVDDDIEQINSEHIDKNIGL